MSFSEWREVKLEDIIEIEMGQSPKSEFYNQTGEGLPFLQGNRTFGDKYPYFDTYCTENKKIANKNDVIMSVRAPVGDLNIAQTQISLGRGVCAMRLKGEQNSNYLFYLMKHNIKEMINRESGTVFGSVNKKDILGLDVKITNNKLEQKSIAHILSTLDDKIEVNNQISKTLENMAQAIFKQWFVDFEFPNEDGEPYKSSGGEMIESELGMIPKGWEVVKLNSVVDICYGKNLPTKNLLSDGYPVFGGNGQIGFYSEYLYEKSQVLIACRGAASGKVIISLPYSFVTNNSLVLEQNGTSVTHEYLKQFCLENEFYNYATGSAQPQITIANLANANILIPQRDLMNMFSLIRNSIDHEVLSLFNENNKLVAIRDALLPKLMSGEIRVPLDEEGDAS